MFADLLDQNIQPKEIDAKSVAEIRISDSLEMKIQKMLEKEEKNYAKVYEHTSVVQTDKNFVFFSNHWLYLQLICRYVERRINVSRCRLYLNINFLFFSSFI